MQTFHKRALHNKDQGEYPRVLFICLMGMIRSATAAHLFASKYNWNTRCAGVNMWAIQPVTESVLEWADSIVVFERDIVYDLIKMHSDISDKIFVVEIDDMFDYKEENLVALLEESVLKVLDERTPDSFKQPIVRG